MNLRRTFVMCVCLGLAARAPAQDADALTGPRCSLPKDWTGERVLPPDTPILVMAGHADSQGIPGAGTPGAAAGQHGKPPMEKGITDELHWALLVSDEVVRLGRQQGLNIHRYVPPARRIDDGEDPRTNWSVGRQHVKPTGRPACHSCPCPAHAAGGGPEGYALEIHFDAYGKDGFGSGLIPPVARQSRVDEALAREWGAYPRQFREGLGGPRRGIALLEVGKLEGRLEGALRRPDTRDRAVQAIAVRVVRALQAGLRPEPVPAPAPGGPGRSRGLTGALGDGR
jgi:hypothetical protein